MFVLRTGLQGNGKTLNTIREVDIKAAKEGRRVYFHNIRGFKPDADVLQAEWVPFDNPLEWHLLPENSIIVIDEAQTFFRVRKQGSAVPEYASALETMRHRGHELHCITQAPALIDVHFRKLCNSHIHYVRGHKGKVIKRWEFERVNSDVERKNTFPDGEATRVILDKKYFGVYQSVADGASHHMKFKAPKALWLFVVVVLLIAYLSWGFYQRRFADPDPEPALAAPVPAAEMLPPEMQPRPIPKDEPLTLEHYLESRIERVPGVPSSAPMYDELTRPVSYPKVFCIASQDEDFVRNNAHRMDIGYRSGRLHGCRCNTQQGTRVTLPFATCMDYVQHGSFDPAIPDRTPLQQAATAGGPGEARAGTPAGAAVPGLVTTGIKGDPVHDSMPWR